MSVRRAIGLAVTCVALAGPLMARAATVDEQDWPREIEVAKGTVTVYQPQLETFVDNKLTARTAVSILPKGQEEPAFGAVWITAEISTDRDTRVVELLSVDVTDVKFPKTDPGKAAELESMLEGEIPTWELTMSLDHLLAMLDLVEKQQRAADNLSVEPPDIIFVTHPAALVTIDGDPKMLQVEGSALMRVANTPVFMVFDPDSKAYYLKGEGEEWHTAAEVTASWKVTDSPPASVVKLFEQVQASEGDGGVAEEDELDPMMPAIVVVTKPTALVFTDGEPEYTPIAGTDLLFMSNTDSDVFMDIDSQASFVLLSGRWYTAEGMEGPWTHVASDALPAGFAKIPETSEVGHVLASVAGTQEATEAVHETYIPQTATIQRDATLAVTYDGEPQFEPIEGTEMTYAVNSPNSVIQVGDQYYCCDNAVWFVAPMPTGTWVVCDSVPPEIQTIPPECPVYPVKYVYVYNSTPEVVYVGYTPGYAGTYVYGGTVVYGTGYYYGGWWGRRYYPRPVTYGYPVTYRRHSGLYAAAGFAAGLWVGSHARGGRWGRRDIDIDIDKNVNINRGNNNLYNRKNNAKRGAARTGGRGGGRPGAAGAGGRAAPKARGGANNVVADRNGNVHRQTNQGWQQRNQRGWSQASRSPASRQRSSAAARSNYNNRRTMQARQRGNQLSRRGSRPARSSRTRSRGGSRSRAGGRGGGGRRGGGRRGGGRRR